MRDIFFPATKEGIIVQRYLDGASINRLEKELHAGKRAIKRCLIQSGIAFRGIKDSVRLLREQSPQWRTWITGRPRTYSVNDQFFNTLTYSSAYVIGLIQADGSLDVKRNKFSISLQIGDSRLLSDIAEAMGASRPIIKQKANGYLAIHSSEICKALQRWGIHRPKTHTAKTHPDLLLDRDYWRGVVDGDGSLCVARDGRRIISLVGSKFICEEFLAFCRHHGCGLASNVNRHKAIYCVQIRNNDAVKMASVLYCDARLALARKSEAYQRFKDWKHGKKIKKVKNENQVGELELERGAIEVRSEQGISAL